MKKIIISAAAVFLGAFAFGQQEFQLSQYMQNLYVINPAAAGLTDYVDVNLGYRRQWQGIANGPETYFVSGSTLLGKNSLGGNELFSLRLSDGYISEDESFDTDENNTVTRSTRHAVGGGFIADQYGHFKTTGGFASYAIHVPVGEKSNFSAGIKAGLTSISVSNELRDELAGNSTANNFFGNSDGDLVPNINIGLFYYSDAFYAGYSTGQLMQNKVTLGNIETDAKLAMHHYITAGYRLELNDKVGLTPSTMIKATAGAPVSFDINAKFDFDRKFWAGLSYRNNDAVVLMAGLNVSKIINIGYAYDFSMKPLNTVSNGSHEILVNFMISK
jgi:type IX secretion system PorP/SprF family membrane protein